MSFVQPRRGLQLKKMYLVGYNNGTPAGYQVSGKVTNYFKHITTNAE